MAYINIRMLLFFLGLVVVLNITQLAMTSMRHVKISHQLAVPFATVDDQNNDTEFLGPKWPKSGLLRKIASTTIAPSTIVDNETCLNTDVTDNDIEFQEEANLCPDIPPDLGPDFQIPAPAEWISELLAGGYFQNKKCFSQIHVAIIVPHSGPKKNLMKFLHHMHPFLMKQQAEYQIFVIDYANKSSPLTQGCLFNVGFQEALKHRNWDCLVFHEHHLVPLNSRNLYRCNWYPRQLVAEIQTGQTPVDNKIYQPTTTAAVGGAIALNPKQFSQVNGFSNRVPGIDNAFLELYKRFQLANYTLEKTDPLIGQYKTFAEPFVVTAAATTEEYNSTTDLPYNLDGLSTLSYEVKQMVYQSLFTYIRVIRSEESGDKMRSFKCCLK